MNKAKNLFSRLTKIANWWQRCSHDDTRPLGLTRLVTTVSNRPRNSPMYFVDLTGKYETRELKCRMFLSNGPDPVNDSTTALL